MQFKEIQELVKLINKSNISELKIEKKDFKITLRSNEYATAKGAGKDTPIAVPLHAPPQPAAAPVNQEKTAEEAASQKEKAKEEDESKYVAIKSPMIGTFYRSSSPDKDPFVKVGDSIGTGDVVCIIEAMKLFNEIESEVSGKIVKVLVENASPVEYDQPLFLVDPA